MISRSIILILAATLAFGGAACRSKAKKNQSPDRPATEMEANFKQRWIDKRVTELITAGQPAENARSQADREFSERFSYIRPSKGK